MASELKYECETCLDDYRQCNCLVDVAPWDAKTISELKPEATTGEERDGQ